MPHRYVAAADGTAIAYRVRGNPQGPALVFTNGFTASDFYWRHILPRLEDQACLVTWDLKGHGASSPARSLQACTIEDSVDDLRRVMDAAGVEQAVLVGFSLGCQVVFEAWRQIPERIVAMVPILGTYGHPFNNLIHPRVGPQLLKLLELVGGQVAGVGLKLAGLSYHLPLNIALNQALGVIGKPLDRSAMKPFFEHMRRIDGPTWAALGQAAQDHSAEDLLAGIDVPVLIIGGGKDTFTPIRLGEEMARQIPGAEYLCLPEVAHTGLLEVPELIAERIARFVDRCGLSESEAA